MILWKLDMKNNIYDLISTMENVHLKKYILLIPQQTKSLLGLDPVPGSDCILG